MQKSLLAIMSAGALALASLAGCSTGTYNSSVSYSDRATTNALPISSGERKFTLKGGEIDYITASHDNYALLPRTPDTEARVSSGLLETSLSENVLLPGRLVPQSNSTITRTADQISINENRNTPYSTGFLANHFYDGQGKLQLNTGMEPKTSWFVIESRTEGTQLTNDALNQHARQIFDEVRKTAGYITVDGRQVISLADKDLEGRSTRVLVLNPQPMYQETRDKTQPDKTIVRFGLIGEGYYPVDGREKEKPKLPKDLVPIVIEGRDSLIDLPEGFPNPFKKEENKKP